ncbi:hypothetical protein NPIL_371371, partial [Nephila pilipes]
MSLVAEQSTFSLQQCKAFHSLHKGPHRPPRTPFHKPTGREEAEEAE